MKKRYQVLFALFLLSIITYLDRVCISIAGVRIKTDLGLSNDQFGWVLGIFAISYGIFEIPTGVMGDKFGPRKILARIVIWWSVFTALTGFASSYVMLLVTRFLFGIGEAGAYPNSSIAISKWFPVEERARAQSIIWTASRVGGALSPLLIIPIQMQYGWKVSFYIFAIIGTIWATVWYFWFRDEPNQMSGISEDEKKELEQLKHKNSKNHSLPWKVIIKNSNLWVLMVMYHFYSYGAFFYVSWMPTYLQEGRGFTEKETSWLAMLPFAMGIFGCLFGGFASDFLVKKIGLKWGRRTVAITGLFFSSMSLFAAALVTDNYTAAIFLASGLAFKDLTLPVSWAVAMDIGVKNSGAISGAMNTFGQLGALIVSVGFGYMLNLTNNNYSIPLLVIASFMLIATLLWFKVDASKTIGKQEEEIEEKEKLKYPMEVLEKDVLINS